MAAVDPYSPCPCGSGEKFKWCCHKVEAQAERAHRLYENGQTEAAVQALNEGLRKEPGNPWLLTRKAFYLVQLGQREEAKETVGQVLQKNRKHLGGQVLLTQLLLETEGPAAGVAQLQQALSAVDESQRPALMSLIRLIGLYLERFGQYPSALRHLKLIQVITGREDLSAPLVRTIERKRTISPWLKNPDALSPPPDGLSGAAREQFLQAVQWAEQGLWSSAASAFEVLSAEPGASPAADRNLGLCRLWLVDYAGAADPLRRAIARLGTSIEAVDLEALRQEIVPPGPDDLVEHVQLIWPLRNRDLLINTLRADPKVQEEGSSPIDPDEPDSPEVEYFALLDRPKLATASGLKTEEIPLLQARVFVGQEIAGLETYDDGRLDGLADRFASLAEGAIAPAHPKTKVLDKLAKFELALSWEWRLPDDIDPEEQVRLQGEQTAWLIREIWPKTPMPYLKGRSPIDAARAGDAVVPLRAALLHYEMAQTPWHGLVNFSELRGRLGLEPEPPIDPATVEIASLHLARLAMVPADRLDDDRLIALFSRSRQFGLDDAVEHSVRAMIARPHLWEKAGTDVLDLHAEMAMQSANRERTAEAFEWVRKGRQADPAGMRAAHAPMWDMLEFRIRARSEKPEAWVPELAVVLERYSRDPHANEAIMLNLLEMGLVQMTPKPDQPRDYLLDSRPLQMLMAEYGPRVTTAAGGLGVSATKGEIWTPGSETGGSGTLWTPGSGAGASPQGEGKPKLIIPGR